MEDRAARDFGGVPGTRFTRDSSGLWYGLEYREGERRTPTLAVDADAYARKVAPTIPTQSDVNEAFRGLKPTPVATPEGGTRLDYNAIPLKHADGSLTKYAKNLIDLHAPGAKAGAEFASEMMAGVQSEEVEKPGGRVVSLPVAAAEPLLKSGKVRTPSRRKRGRSGK